MRILSSRPATAIALAAVLSLGATPAMAEGWGGHRHHRHHRGVDGGDVLAGVLILGGIAAIASAASKNSRDKRDQDYRYEDRDPADSYPDRREDSAGYRSDGYDGEADARDGGRHGASGESGALNRAVDGCVAEIERGNREVESVDSVRRNGPDWTVEGRTGNGRDFTCSVDGEGHVSNAKVEGTSLR